MTQPRAKTRDGDRDSPPGERLAAAFGALVFFAPLLFLFWFLANSRIAWLAERPIPWQYLFAAIGASTLLGFAMPRLTPAVFGWIARGFHWLARLW